MGILDFSMFNVGGLMVLVGVLLVLDAPYIKDLRDSNEWLKKNNRLLGTAVSLLGFLVMALSVP